MADTTADIFITTFDFQELSDSALTSENFKTDFPFMIHSPIGKYYRMRGFDTNVLINRIVYWNANFIDTNATQYPGSSGPVTNIIVSKVITDK